jgi:hypothetical protein
MGDAARYILDEDEVLDQKTRDGVTAPFIEFELHGDLMQKMHAEHGHLSPQSLANVLEYRTWWARSELSDSSAAEVGTRARVCKDYDQPFHIAFSEMGHRFK